MKDSLIQSGLTAAQADIYLLLLDEGPLAPPAIAVALGLTRSNAYKVLEQLMDFGLAIREEKQKKYIYRAGDPAALNDLLASERNKLIAREKAVNSSLQSLRSKYRKQAASTEVKAYRGITKIKHLYERQAELKQPIHFVKSRSDIPVLGYETMRYVRRLPARYGTPRFGITPDVPEAASNVAVDLRTNLTRTWMDANDYTAPVEWSVSGDEVTIFVFEKNGSAVHICNPAIADSLRQIWSLIDRKLRESPEYEALPARAERSV